MDWEALKQRDPKLYHVAHDRCTEPEFSGAYVQTKDRGTYCCAVCELPLFSSKTKFESGSGWPSFTKPVKRSAIVLKKNEEYGTRSIEVECARCGSYIGRVFPDGPKKFGRVSDRYCINSVSLDLCRS